MISADILTKFICDEIPFPSENVERTRCLNQYTCVHPQAGNDSEKSSQVRHKHVS